jgi:hypothetical protein
VVHCSSSSSSSSSTFQGLLQAMELSAGMAVLAGGCCIVLKPLIATKVILLQKSDSAESAELCAGMAMLAGGHLNLDMDRSPKRL